MTCRTAMRLPDNDSQCVVFVELAAQAVEQTRLGSKYYFPARLVNTLNQLRDEMPPLIDRIHTQKANIQRIEETQSAYKGVLSTLVRQFRSYMGKHSRVKLDASAAPPLVPNVPDDEMEDGLAVLKLAQNFIATATTMAGFFLDQHGEAILSRLRQWHDNYNSVCLELEKAKADLAQMGHARVVHHQDMCQVARIIWHSIDIAFADATLQMKVLEQQRFGFPDDAVKGIGDLAAAIG